MSKMSFRVLQKKNEKLESLDLDNFVCVPKFFKVCKDIRKAILN